MLLGGLGGAFTVIQLEPVSHAVPLAPDTVAALSPRVTWPSENGVEVSSTFQPSPVPVASATSSASLVVLEIVEPVSWVVGNATGATLLKCKVPAARSMLAVTQASLTGVPLRSEQLAGLAGLGLFP